MKKTVRTIMKVTTIILGVITCFSTMLIANTTDAQNLKNVKLNIAFQNETLASALAKLENNTHIAFSYDENVLKGKKAPQLNYKGQSLDIILNNLLKGSGFEYDVLNNNIVIGKQRKKPVPPDPGKIYGKIVDDKGETLPGATIKIVELNKVVTAAVDGSYTISAAEGSYTLEVSYISYQTKKITTVMVKSGGLTKLDIVLASSDNALKNVTITSSFKKEAIAGLYAQQKNAASITDGISAEQIARTPDNNMGQVMKRISGISTVDNRYVVVRGLTERYNQGMIDGIVLPSTDMNRHNFAFDVIPAELVSNVVVNKTATPDVSSEFSGGQVSVNTSDIPVDNFTIISVGTGFNSLTLGKDFQQAGKRGKYDFLGFDDGHRKLPEGIKSWGSGIEIPDYAVPQSKLFSPDVFKTYTSTGGLNQNYRISAGRVYNLKNDQKWGFVAGVTLRNSQETNDYIDVRGFPIIPVYLQSASSPVSFIDSTKVRRDGHIYKYNTTAGAQFNIGVQGKTYKIGLRNIFSQILNNTYNTSTGADAENASTEPIRIRKNIQDPTFIRIMQDKLEGEHTLTQGGLKLTWLAARTYVRQETKGRTKFSYRLTATRDGVEYYQDPMIANPSISVPNYDYRIYTDTKETDYNWAANLSQPFKFLGDKSLVKAGYNGIKKQRSLNVSTLNIRTEDRAFNNFDRPYEELLSPENMGTGVGQAYYLADGGNGLQFDGKSNFHAAYLMMDQRFLNRIRIVYGMRAEIYNMKNQQSAALSAGDNPDITGEKNTRFLPSANLTYSITPKMNFRASFAKTVIRPDFRETSYFGYYDAPLDANILGANLQSTKINNTDLRYEWYPSAGEVFSVSGFYKTFDKPIELVARNNGSGFVKEYIYQNQKNATNYGIELEIRKSLGFIAANSWLNNISVFGNGTLIKSKVNTVSLGGINLTTIIEDKASRALYGQAPYSVNAGIIYDSADYGLTLNYNRSGHRTSAVNTDPARTEFENGRDQLDMQLFGRFLKRKIEVKVNIGNLLNSETIFYVNANGYKEDTANRGEGNFTYLPAVGNDSYEKRYDDVRYRIKYGISSNISVAYKF